MIVIIDNYDSFTYNLYQSVANYYPEVCVFRNDEKTVLQLQQLPIEAIVLSPGPGRPEHAGICVELIKKLSPAIPILGVCLGHQAIAIAFGARVTKANNIVHGKSTEVFHRRQVLFQNLSLPFKAGRYHSLIVEKKSLPPTLYIEAENEDGLIMAIKHTRYPCFGIQFHPESILTPEGPQFLRNFVDYVTTQPHKIAVC